jgi:hypothetical protein
MTNYLLPLLLGVCWIGNTIAEDRTVRAHTPPQSPFHALGDESLSWPRWQVEYEGRATISARYRFVFDEETGYQQNPYLYFEPSPESQAQLPYLTRWVHESDQSTELVKLTEHAKEIWVINVAEAAAALLGKPLAEEVLAGKHEQIVGEAIVVIEGFNAGYECDTPSFSARFVEVKRELSAAAPGKRVVGGC